MPGFEGWRAAAPDARILFATRMVRMAAYGLLSVVLVLYLAEVGLSPQRIGLLLTLTLAGDTVISLWMTTSADRRGRRKMLMVGALLMVFAGVLFAVTRDFGVLLLAAIIGVISPSGNEVGPFLSIEQASLAHLSAHTQHTLVFAWYNVAGSFAVAGGTLAGGGLAQWGRNLGVPPLATYRVIVLLYAALGVVLALLFLRLSPAVEVSQHRSAQAPGERTFLGLHRSRGIVLKLAALFGLDAFAGGFVMQSLLVYWFHLRFGLEAGFLGAVFAAANILAGISALSAARLAARFGLINTMVFTHLPSNVLLILVPLMPNAGLAILVLLARFAISQMDVPTRQAYTVSVVDPDERSAAAGVTGIARSIGAGIAPLLVGRLLASSSLLNVPLFLAGGLKIIYDLLLYRSFRSTTRRAAELTRFTR
jgi:MFS family permease